MSKKINNLILNTDSYKLSHYMQYPPGSKNVHSYIEARGSSDPDVTEVVHFGVQSFIKEYLLERITMADVIDSSLFAAEHGVPFNREGWEYIVKAHNGYLPIVINTVPEGTPVPIGNQVVSVFATDPNCAWLVSYIETALLRAVWYGSTVATLSREVKRVILDSLRRTSDDPENEIMFKMHDFGARGVSSQESAGLGGAAHLINFMGTDTIAGILHAKEFYEAGACGFSIPASEHSTMTSWGEHCEFDAYKNMVEVYAKPQATFACVIDSYDWERAIDLWTTCPPDEEMSLTDRVKQAGATVVLRPDSGHPVDTPVRVVEMLIERLGASNNSKGYLVLPDHVRVIQGDGIGKNEIVQILQKLEDRGISASNIAFGVGGGLLQKVNRDTFKFAMKASAILIEDTWRDVFKLPKGQPDKASKRGRLLTLKHHLTGQFVTVNYDDGDQFREGGYENTMFTAYSSHRGTVKTAFISFDRVRQNAIIPVPEEEKEDDPTALRF